MEEEKREEKRGGWRSKGKQNDKEAERKERKTMMTLSLCGSPKEDDVIDEGDPRTFSIKDSTSMKDHLQ